MSLLIQFQLFIGLMVITFGICFVILIFNNLFNSKKVIVIRFIFEPILYMLFAYFYYAFIGKFASGRLNLFYILSIFMGGFIFFKFYYRVIDIYLKDKICKIKTKIYKGIKLHSRAIGVKLSLQKVKRKKKDEKN